MRNVAATTGNPNNEAMTATPMALMLSPVIVSMTKNTTAKNEYAQATGK